ncbi:hypothetical protein U0F29_32690, partial [Bacillus thuringiensis]|nr:hypothetical protein [Bacillus thuringiensis]
RIMGEKRNVKDAFTFERDANGQETKVKDHVNGVEKSKTYDTADRIMGEKRNGKDAFTFERDANGQETKVKDHVNGVEKSK